MADLTNDSKWNPFVEEDTNTYPPVGTIVLIAYGDLDGSNMCYETASWLVGDTGGYWYSPMSGLYDFGQMVFAWREFDEYQHGS